VTRSELVSELAVTLGARHEARFLVEEVLGSASPGDVVVEAADADTVRTLARRRRSGEPLQYVLGHWAFRTLDLLVDPRVLVPRPETEQVVQVALEELARVPADAPVNIVDAGTGTGAIALSLAVELADRPAGGAIWATDASADALAVAVANLERVRARARGLLPITFVRGSWLTTLPPALKGSVGLVVSNPPYVARGEWPELPDDVRREPFGALVAPDGTDGTPGLGDVEEVLSQAWAWLARPGAVVVELAPQQADAAARLARRVGYRDVRVAPDLSARPRALVGRTQ
jgi:release factor glutamine methyltransferase